jgi:hypothetical protein
MLISELIHKLTIISRKCGDLEVVNGELKEIINVVGMVNASNNKKQAVIIDATELKDQLA